MRATLNLPFARIHRNGLVVILGCLTCWSTAQGQTVYSTSFDDLTTGIVQFSPGAPGQDGFFNAGVPGTYSEIQSSIALAGNALRQVSPIEIGNAGQTVAARNLNGYGIQNSIVIISAAFYGSSSNLGFTNPFSASLYGRDSNIGAVAGFSVYGGNGQPKSVTGINVSLIRFNGSNNNDPFTPSNAQHLSWNAWHQVTVVADFTQNTWTSITVDGVTVSLAGVPLPRNPVNGQWVISKSIDRVIADIVSGVFPGQSTHDEIVWDNITLTASNMFPCGDWIVAHDGTFQNPAEWNCGIVPAAWQDAKFGGAASSTEFTVTFTSSRTSQSLEINNQAPIFKLNGFQYSLTNGTKIGQSQKATLTITNGGLASPTVTISSRGTLAGDGTISGDVSNAGTVRPGLSGSNLGTFTINGDYTQSAGAVFKTRFTSSQYSSLLVAGDAHLAGTIKMELVGGANPPDGSYQVMPCFGSLDGQFSAAVMPYLGAGRAAHVEYAPSAASGGVDGGTGGVIIVIGSSGPDPEFGPPQTVSIAGEPTGITGAKVNNLPVAQDAAIAIKAPSDADPGNVVVLVNQNDGTAFTPTVVAVGRAPSGIASAALADLSNDDDFAVPNKADNTVSALFHYGAAAFTRVDVPVGGGPSAIAAGHLRGAAGSDRIDLVVANESDNTISILQNNGNRSFTVLSSIDVGLQPDAVAVADLLGSSLPEIIIANAGDGTISILPNMGGNTYAPPIVLPVGVRPGQVRPADIDNDRDVDVIVCNQGSGTISVILNNGGGTFAPAITLPVDGSPLSVDLWDMDQDGDLDLAAVVDDEELGESVIRLLRNDFQSGSGVVAFTLFDPVGQGENPKLVSGTDLSGDAVPDLLTVNVAVLPMNDGGKAGSTNSFVVRKALPATPVSCLGDIAPASPNFDHVVNVSDLLAVINQWGTCAGTCPPYCSADINHDCTVNVTDLLSVINHWGPCP